MCDGLEILGLVVTEINRKIRNQWIQVGGHFLEGK